MFQNAVTEYKNTPWYDGLAPTQWAFGYLQRTDVPAPKSAYEKITDEKLLEHIGWRGKVLRSVLMNSPKRSFKTSNPGDRCIFKTRKSYKKDIHAQGGEVNPLAGSRHSGRRKQPPPEAKIDHTTSVFGPLTRSWARTSLCFKALYLKSWDKGKGGCGST